MGTPAPAGGGGGGYGLTDNFESARSDRSEIISHRTYEVKSSPAVGGGAKSGGGGSPGGALNNAAGGGGGGVMAGTTASSTTNSMLIAPPNGYNHSPHHQQLTAANLHQHNMYEQQQMMQGTASGHGGHSAHNSIVSANSVGLNSGLGLPPGAAHALALSAPAPTPIAAPNGLTGLGSSNGGGASPHQPTATVTVVDPTLRPSGSFKASGGSSASVAPQPAAESELALRPAPPTTGTLIQPGSTLPRASSRDTAPAIVTPTPTAGGVPLTPPPVAVHNIISSGDHTPSHAIGANGLVGAGVVSPPPTATAGLMIAPTH